MRREILGEVIIIHKPNTHTHKKKIWVWDNSLEYILLF